MASITPLRLPRENARSPIALADGKWRALSQVAGALADIAGAAGADPLPDEEDFAERLAAAGPQRRILAEQGIEDMIAFVEPGICALLLAHERGSDMRAGANSLLQEIETARTSVLALVA